MRPPDLVFDARHVHSGLGSYTRRLLEVLPAWAERHAFTVNVLTARDHDLDIPFKTRPSKAPMYSLAEQRLFDDVVRRSGARAFFTPHYPAPLSQGSSVFVTIHDILQTLPRTVSGQSLAKRAYARGMLHFAANRAERVFAVSAFTRERLIELGVPSDRVVVAPARIDPRWWDPVALSEVASSQRLVDGPFIVYVGNVKPHKNLRRLLAAFDAAAAVIPHRLVLAGGGVSRRDLDVAQLQLASRHRDRVVVTGSLEFGQLRALVAGADALVQPSLYEGVGLPPLEAMAVGTAVLAARSAALPETCGHAAEYFDPWSVEDLSERMVAVVSTPARRDQLVAAGRLRVRERDAQIDELRPLEIIASYIHEGKRRDET